MLVPKDRSATDGPTYEDTNHPDNVSEVVDHIHRLKKWTPIHLQIAGFQLVVFCLKGSLAHPILLFGCYWLLS